MKILVASDSFKGSLTSEEVGKAIQTGIHSVMEDAEVTVVTVADGGEGTVDAIINQTNGTFIERMAQDPHGKLKPSKYGIFGDNAIIECASASGIHKLDPLHIESASSYGTGALILDALNRGSKTLYIALGGSGTNDAGLGLLIGLGYEFFDCNGMPVQPGIVGLETVASMRSDAVSHTIQSANIVVLCDVENPLCGDTGATAIFGPQKGVLPENIARYDAAIKRFSDFLVENGFKDTSNVKGSGAAGGMAFACMCVLGAQLRSGVETVMDILELDQRIQGCNLVVTGEGRMDYQTAFGKLPVGVARRAKAHNVPCVAIVGSLGTGYHSVYDCGIDAVESTIIQPCTLEVALMNANTNVIDASERLFRKLRLNIK